ncbi:hypothetical protein GF325_09945 [Candidatus Bathyarchaeota archaeon]|nr:hypothetical protein [Candidatus Bathyarchaeota archaeon]
MRNRFKKTEYDGFLVALNVKNMANEDGEITAYWNRVKDNLYVIGDEEDKKLVFLNRELQKVAEKYEGTRVKITIEPLVASQEKAEHVNDMMPDLGKEFKGFERFKRVLMNIFRIT